MRSNKFYKILSLGIVLILLMAFSDTVIAQRKKRQSARPIISVAKIYKDIVGKRIVDILPESTGNRSIGWTFQEYEPKEIQILQNKVVGDEAYVIIKMFTQGAISNNGLMARLRGNLRLHYERIAGGWLLTEVQNLNLKYAVYNSSGNTNNQGNNSVSVPSVIPLVSGAFTIPAGNSSSKRFVVPNRAIVSGRFRAPGENNNVEVFIVDEDGYENFTKGYSINPIYNSGKVAVGTVNVTLGEAVRNFV